MPARPSSLTVFATLAIVVPLALPNGARPRVRPPIGPAGPAVTLAEADPIVMEPVDSNSPAVWDIEDGQLRLFVMVSSQRPRLSIGSGVHDLTAPAEAMFEGEPPHGVWIEAIVKADDGTWYGYYHEEPGDRCDGSGKTIPRIGAARSHDRGRSWEDLGVVLAAPDGTSDCASPNKYFVGGVGDFSVLLDRDATDLYFFFSAYPTDPGAQGVAMARMAWASRDDPRGAVDVWQSGAWVPTSLDDEGTLDAPLPTPIFAALRSWHSSDAVVDAFWGPSVHWNTYLEQYVMLLNRAEDADWTQEGIYVSFGRSLDDPASWSEPRKILDRGSWYPQVIGLEPGAGTDKVAGQTARFFMSGVSSHTITFGRR